jgi:hypothetical protein
MDKIEPVAIRRILDERLESIPVGHYEEVSKVGDAALELGAMLDERDALLSENARLRAFAQDFIDTYYSLEDGEELSTKYFADKARAALSAQEDA